MSSNQAGNESLRLSSGDDPVAIRLYARSIDAALDVATLESHGISAEISGDTVGDTLNWYGLAVKKVELIVPRRKAAEAQQILADRSARTSRFLKTAPTPAMDSDRDDYHDPVDAVCIPPDSAQLLAARR